MSITPIIDIDTIHVKAYAIQYGNATDQCIRTTERLACDLEMVNNNVADAQREIDNTVYLEEGDSLNIDIDVDLALGYTEVSYEYSYETNHEIFEKLADAISEAIGMDLPDYSYYSYTYKQPNNNAISCGSVNTFRELTEVAYNNPWDFTCNQLNKEEQKYIDAIMALKIAEKLGK